MLKEMQSFPYHIIFPQSYFSGFSHEMINANRDDFLLVDYDNIDGVDTGFTPNDFSSILMYNPADTMEHTKNGEPAIKYHTPPTMSWPGTTDDDLLSAIDKVEISVAYGCDIGQSLMVDYVNLNRLSVEARLENITKEKTKNDGKNSDQCKCQDQLDRQEERMSKHEEQNSKQEEKISKLEEQLRNLKQEQTTMAETIAKVTSMGEVLRDIFSTGKDQNSLT